MMNLDAECRVNVRGHCIFLPAIRHTQSNTMILLVQKFSSACSTNCGEKIYRYFISSLSFSSVVAQLVASRMAVWVSSIFSQKLY